MRDRTNKCDVEVEVDVGVFVYMSSSSFCPWIAVDSIPSGPGEDGYLGGLLDVAQSVNNNVTYNRNL